MELKQLPDDTESLKQIITSQQHQIDHLQGKMYFDRLGKVKRDMLLRRAEKLKR